MGNLFENCVTLTKSRDSIFANSVAPTESLHTIVAAGSDILKEQQKKITEGFN